MLYRYRSNPEYALVATCTKRRGEEVARSADSLPYFLLDSSCRLPAASDVSRTATILVRGAPTAGRKCIQYCVRACVYIYLEKRNRGTEWESRKIGNSI